MKNRLVMHRARGLSGPLFQDIGGGRLIHSMGNFIAQASIPTPSFSYFSYDAATYELSDALASGRVAVINVPKDDGNYGQVPTTKVAYPKSRIVTNLMPDSDNYSGWLGAFVPVTDGNLFTALTNNALKYPIGNGVTGANLIGSVELMKVTGSGNVSLSGDGGRTYKPLVLTTEWQRFSASGVSNNTNTLAISIGTAGDSIRVRRDQAENATDRVDKQTPSEFIETNGTPVTKQFANANGNTVHPTTRIVTEGVGAPLDPQPYAVSAPAATNYCLESSTLLTGWTNVRCVAPELIVAPSGVSRWKVTCNASFANAGFGINRSSTVTPTSVTLCQSADVEIGTARYASLITLNFGSTSYGTVFDMQTGAVSGAYYLNTIGLRPTITPIKGGWHISHEIPENDGAGNVYVFFGNASDGKDSVSGQYGYCTNINLTSAPVSPPITTTTVPVTRDKDVIAAPLANLNQPSNSGYIEVNVATGSTPAILGAFLSFDGTDYKLTDGTSTVSVAGTVGGHKLGWYAGPGGMNLCVDGVWGTEQPYDAILAAALGLFTNSTYPQEFRNFVLWAEASQAAIDARMAA